MVVPEKIFLTREGYEKLRRDLDGLRERFAQVTKEIAEAAEKGDLKENAEYHAAKEEQQKVQRRRDEIEQKLRSASLIEEADIKTDEIRIGCTVTLKDAKTGETVAYTLVDGAEADFSKGRISVRSPLAQAILGFKKGDRVPVKLSGGQVDYLVQDVVRSF